MDFRHYIDRGRLIRTFTELISINSPSFHEREIGEYLRKRLEAAGCRVELQEYGSSFNLIGYKEGTLPDSPTLILSAHMDTIEPTSGIKFVVDDEAIRSVGDTVLGADDKGALAQIIELLDIIKERDIPHPDLEMVFTSSEENGLHGAKNLDFGMLKGRRAVVLDSSGSVGKVITRAPSHHTYEMKITGRPAHAGIEPEKGLSAIKAASRIISLIPDGRLGPDTTANIGTIKGGTATNVVPKEVAVKGEVRSHDPARLNEVKREIFGLAKREAREIGVTLEISETEEYRTFRINEDDPFLQFVTAVMSSVGIDPVQAATGGGSDANIFNQKGITAINLSNGMQKVHSTEEFIYIDDLYKGTLVILGIIIEAAKLRKS